MRHKTWLLLSSALSLTLAGCGDSGSDDSGVGGTSAGGTSAGGTSAGGTSAGGTAGTGVGGSGGSMNTCSATFDATVANNYTFSSTITMPPVLVQPEAELTFDWSAVTTDFLGHDMDPAADVDAANLVLWALNETDLQTSLNADSLRSSDAVIPATAPTNQTTTSVTLFEFLAPSGQPLTEEEILPYMSADTYAPEDHTYTFIITTGGDLVSGGRSRMIQAMKLDPTSTNTMITLSNDSTQLEYDADLQSLIPTMVPAAQADLTISWEDILTNAMGNTFLPTQITEVRVAHYTQPLAELEEKFLDLELIAEETWRNLEIAGTDLSLSTLTNDGGEPFPGVSDSGTWVLGLVCGVCRNPAPWYLTVLQPCQ